MRPLELRMTAFGSYAGATTIPFDRLKRGLYLVAGDTGSGKTTIFDAIMFALYGRASGTDRDRVDMLHSDYVSRAVDTVVELRFSQDDRECVVTRRIHFIKKRGGSGEYGDARVDAELWEPDRPALGGATRVTARCEELLGLNAEQFRKIIMLAQGEFKEFLKADSDKKGEILSKLFDSSSYRWYQKLLCAARDELRKRREGHVSTLRALLQSGFQIPEGLSEEQKLLYAPEHPELPANLRNLIDAEAGALSKTQEALNAAQKRVNGLNERKGAAVADNQLLTELDSQAARMRQLEGRREEFALRRETAELAERALRQAKPAIDSFEEAERALRETRLDMERLEALISDQERAYEAALASTAGDEADREAASRLTNAVQKIVEQLPKYDELEALSRERLAAEEAEAAGQVREQKATEERDCLAEELRTIRGRLAALEMIDARVLEAQNCASETGKRLDDLDGENGVRRAVMEIRKLERQLVSEKEKWIELTREAASAAERHNLLYGRFIAGQAGLLAADLRTRVEAAGEARCPVCGSMVCREHLLHLSEVDPDTPDKVAVDRAKSAAEQCEKARADQQMAVERLETRIQGDQRNVVERARRCLAACETWEQLREEGYLRLAIAQARAEKQEADEALGRRVKEREQRDAEREKLPQTEAELQKLEAVIKQGQEEARQWRAEADKLAAIVLERRSQLKYEDRMTAQEAQQGMAMQRDELNRRVKARQDALEAAKEQLNTNRGRMETLRSRLEAQDAKRAEAFDHMNAVLALTGFANAAEVAAALAPTDGQDGESWLKAQQKALHDYESDLENTRQRIVELTAQTAGKTRVDVDALQEEILEAEGARDAINREYRRWEALLANHCDVAWRAEELKRSLSDTDVGWSRIDKLANMAMGMPGDDGKRSFERYVLSAVFMDILEMANQRLNRMSGGRYELVLRTGARRANGAAGLDVDVLDYTTNQQRPSASLSGGEAFFTSLSLALGLSDVVQNHAGGRQIDALFIDEGFGTLSDGYLDKALEILNQLTEGNRLVGIISHVDKLDESIPQKIRVSVTENGSRIESIVV